jgi:hypothetical protein
MTIGHHVLSVAWVASFGAFFSTKADNIDDYITLPNGAAAYSVG